MSDIDKRLLDADGSGRLLPQSKPDQIIGPGAALTAKIVSAHQSELARLKAENLTQAEEIRRLRETLENQYDGGRNCYRCHSLEVDCDRCVKTQQALTPTPTTWGQKALDVIEAALARHRFKPGFDLFKLDVPLDEACEALSERQKEKGNN